MPPIDRQYYYFSMVNVEQPDRIDPSLFKSTAEDGAYSTLMNFIVNEQTLFRYAEEISEPMAVPDLLGKSVKASSRQFAGVYWLASQICAHLKIDVPDIYIYEGYQYLIDSNGCFTPRLEISARMVRDFSEPEFTHCLAKELTHIALGHIRTEVLTERMQEAIQTLASLPIVNTLNIVGGPRFYTMALRVKAFRWFREAIFTAENFATAYTGNVKASVTSTLLQVFNDRRVVGEIDIAEFCDQVGLIEMIEGAAATYTKMDEVIPYAPYRVGNILQYASSGRGIKLRHMLQELKRSNGSR